MKKVIALLLMLMLVACSKSTWISVSDDPNYAGYSIYVDGKLVCESAANCKINIPRKKEMLLEVRKGDVVYGYAILTREKGHNQGDLDVARGSLRVAGKMGSSIRTQSDALLYVFVAGPVLLGATIAPIISALIPHYDSAPTNVTVPAGPSDSTRVPFPWDQPAKD